MSDMPPRAPSGLGRRGREYWKRAQAQLEFTDTEEVLLLEVVRCMDRLDVLDKSIRELGPMVLGSSGQDVVNPALTEARGQQAILHRLMGALQLEDVDGTVIRSPRHVAGVNSQAGKWRYRG